MIRSCAATHGSKEHESPQSKDRLWELKQVKGDEGYRVYVLKEKYRTSSEVAELAQGALFPAVEPTAKDLPREFAGYGANFRELGYEWKEGDLKLPERETFLRLWERLRSRNPSLPEISIYRCPNGTASDAQFLEAHLTHDALLSEGDEFVHDHIYHIVPLLRRIFSAQADQYAKSRNELVDGLSKQIACIAAFRKATPDRKEWADQAEKLTAMLLDGTLVIDSWSSWPERPFSHSLADQYMVLMKHPEWMNYWNCRYGPSEKKLFVGFQSVEKFHASTSSPTAGSRA